MDNTHSQHQHTQNDTREAVSSGPQTTPLNDGSVPAPSPYSPTYSADVARSQEVPKPTRKRGGLVGFMLAGALALGMLLGGAGAEAVQLIAHNNTAATTQASQDTSATDKTGSGELVAQADQSTIGSIYKEVSPSVVMISTRVQAGGRFGRGEGTGSGVVIDGQGHILTNYHVVQGADTIRIELADGSEYVATVVGTAPQDDLAVLKVAAPDGKLAPAELGDSSTVQVGDEVIAVGYPFGLDQSVTSGIVSGLNRQGAGRNGGRTLTGLIQVDAAINPGNSGGPLLNADGKVIGINTMIESPVEGFTGVGLAIPINTVKNLLSQLEQGGEVQRPWIGIAGTEITTNLKEEYNLPVSQGILVAGVTPGSPAADAGLQPATVSNDQGQGQIGAIGDIIVAIDGQKVGSVADLTSYLNGKRPGDKVTLSIIRNGQQQDVSITLEAWSTSSVTSSGS